MTTFFQLLPVDVLKHIRWLDEGAAIYVLVHEHDRGEYTKNVLGAYWNLEEALADLRLSGDSECYVEAFRKASAEKQKDYRSIYHYVGDALFECQYSLERELPFVENYRRYLFKPSYHEKLTVTDLDGNSFVERRGELPREHPGKVPLDRIKSIWLSDGFLLERVFAPQNE